MSMESYHHAWLAAHPDRTEGWLRDRLAEGFDVHHLDGDHSNDDPLNLVLIEHLDHMRVHGMPGNRLLALRTLLYGGAAGGSMRDWKATDQYKRDRERVASKRVRRLERLDRLELLP